MSEIAALIGYGFGLFILTCFAGFGFVLGGLGAMWLIEICLRKRRASR